MHSKQASQDEVVILHLYLVIIFLLHSALFSFEIENSTRYPATMGVLI